MAAFGVGNIGGFFSGVASGGAMVLQIFFLLGIVGFAVYIILNERKYKIKADIARVLSNGKRLWFRDTAKVVRSKKHGVRWKFKKIGTMDPPDETVQELGVNGKILVIGAEDASGNVTWHAPNITKDNMTTPDYKPITNNDKRALRYEIARSRQYQENMLTKIGMPIAFGFVMVMMLAVVLLFWGKAVEPINKAAKTTGANVVEIKELDKEIAEIKRETTSIRAGIQRISGEEIPLKDTGGNGTGVSG